MPITRLSKENIRRAKKALGGKYKRLGKGRRQKVLFATAWKIQRARVKRTRRR